MAVSWADRVEAVRSDGVIRYRRDVGKRCVEFVKETWEVWDGYTCLAPIKGLRLVESGQGTWRAMLEGWELTATRAGWDPPDNFTYVDELPPNAIRVL